MARALPRVDPLARTPVQRAFARLAGTRPVGWFSRKVMWKLDPVVMRWSKGRIRMGAPLPTALLETTGARSGAPRANAVIYFHDGDRVTFIASRLGDPRHPAWFHNLVANPDVTFGGAPYRAQVIEDEAERARIWALADRIFPAYALYRERAARAGRTIPIVQLAPR